jgi:hypothetical protein
MFSRLFSTGSDIEPTAPQGEASFPRVQGRNLNGRKFTLPDDIEGKLALLYIAFKQHQQADIDTWIPSGRQLTEQYPELAVYELPTIYRLPGLSQAFIDGGMRAGIPDPVARATTITLYLDRDEFCSELAIPNIDTIHVLLVNAEGHIFWRTSGQASHDKLASLKQHLARLFT